jgi:hypothetical protein
MDRRRRVPIVLLSVAVLASLTLACLPGLPSVSNVIPGGAETPAGAVPVGTPSSEEWCGNGVCAGPETADTCPQDCAAPPPEETPAAPPPAETAGPVGPFEANVDALNNLASYAYTFHFEGLSTTSGTVEHSVVDIQGQRQNQPTRTEQLSFSSSDGEASTAEFIYIQDQGKMWTRESGGEWTEVPVVDQSMVSMFDAFSMGFWWTTLFGTTGEEAQLVGQETVNGVLTNHYQTVAGTPYLFSAGCNWGSSHDDAWVAVDGNFPVKRQLDASGECQGESGEVHFHMEISNINQPVSVSPPM